MSKIEGNFIFRVTDNKNLIGEYSNQFCTEAFVEAAKRVECFCGSEFSGMYHTTWIEENAEKETKSQSSYLFVRLKRGSTQIHQLSWRAGPNENSNESFRGEGFIHSGMLSGHYHPKSAEPVGMGRGIESE